MIAKTAVRNAPRGDGDLGRLPVSSTLGLAILAALAVPLFFYRLGAAALVDPDEPYYAVPAVEMLRRGIWAIPVFRGEPWFDKPVLFYWAVLGAFRALGVSEVAARLASAVSGVLGAAALFRLSPRSGADRRSALLAAIVLATSLEYALLARAAITDMMLTLFLTLGMLATGRYLERGGSALAGVAGAAFGLAVLTKGPIGIVVPVLALGAFGALARRSDLVRPGGLAAAATGFMLTAAPWYVYVAATRPDLLFDSFLRIGNFGRFLHAERASFPLFYVIVLAIGMLPWSGGLPAAFATAVHPSAWRAERGAGRPVGALYALCWFGAVVAPFAASASKLASYVLPALPPAALLLGRYWSRAMDERPRRLADPRVEGWIGVALASLLAAGLAVASGRPRWAAAGPGLLAMGAILLAGASLSMLAIRRRSVADLFAIRAVAGSATVVLAVLAILPRLEPMQSTRPLVESLRTRGLSDEVIGAFHVHDVSLDYYMGRTVARVEGRDALLSWVRKRPGALWIVRTEDLSLLRRHLHLKVDLVTKGPNRCAARLAQGGAGAEERS